eukprot:CAMPEP_0115502954 /NCGR_PEP_ID=MMETSP0271-20121206/69219_1 /TAXON_ID=71861 /ORGANISM="Scrippsiella trochoidea, Strain CCMP3099" /LENGTH=89 /DNA_ID=CAMNT_0002932015 /DNA_START=26 /DNA_END=295 /DNA_ORIENTATION=-
MASVVDTRVAVRTYAAALKEKGHGEASAAERKVVVNGVANAVSTECAAYTADFFACFQHRFALSSCTDATVAKMLKCQQQLSGQLLSTQ